ncbi:fibronectin type 3 and ankyrin repeat domains protein 1-like [Dysidea avara]|uniref:fibronectin type 3 and ankyrin repeat domains protein 1-like n=1 Tax=Dysidea avara TaxID=196820 RepID=UPI00332FA32B
MGQAETRAQDGRKLRKPNKEEKKKIETAAHSGDVSVLQQLFTSGVNVTGVVGEVRITGLHVAASNGHCNVASTLLNWGAKVDAVTTVYKCTPLHLAVRWDHTDVVTLLVEKGANVNMKNALGRTPLESAVDDSNSSIVYYFIREVGMDPTQCDQWDQQRIKELIEREEKIRESAKKEELKQKDGGTASDGDDQEGHHDNDNDGDNDDDE